MAQRPDSTLPPVPNYSFNPGPNVSTGPAEIQIQKQQQEQQQYQNEISTIAKTAQMASGLVQSFVEASKQRQQADALRAYQSFDPSTPIGQLPNAAFQRNQALAKILASNPTAASDAIIKQQYPGQPSSLQALIARSIASGNQQQTLAGTTAAQALQKPASLKTTNVTVDGKPTSALFDPKSGNYLDPASKQPITGTITPYVQPSDYGIRRERIATNQDLTHMAGQIKNVLNNTPAARTVAAADNFLNQVQRAKDGSVIVDKPTATMFATELDRALTGSGGQVSEERVKALIPKALEGQAADIATYVKNNPTDKNVQAFLNNYAIEVKAQRDQRGAVLTQTLGPILASAKLAQREDPEGYRDTVKSLGLDPDAAKKGEVKFLPGTNSVLYGAGKTDTGLPSQAAPQADQSGWITLSNGIKYRVKKGQ